MSTEDFFYLTEKTNPTGQFQTCDKGPQGSLFKSCCRRRVKTLVDGPTSTERLQKKPTRRVGYGYKKGSLGI